MSDVNGNMRIWDAVCRPPEKALKKIQGGRLTGKSDINPQWRIKALTEQFGPCGVGWKYEIVRLWTEPGVDGVVFAFTQLNLYTRMTYPEGEVIRTLCPQDAAWWSAPTPGVGGHKLVELEKSGLYNNDEAYKMSTTDALGVAAKMLGVAADIYLGNFDGSKYLTPPDEELRRQEAAHKKLMADAVEAGMRLLEVAAEDGEKALKMAWESLTVNGREACKNNLAALKERAKAADAEKGSNRVKK